MESRLFTPVLIGSTALRNRIVRSATFEGMCDADGCPTSRYLEMYRDLASRGAGAIVTGFVYISRNGKAVQPGQGGMDSATKIAPFQKVTQAVRERQVPLLLQLAHAGRQTRSEFTGEPVVGASTRRSLYFRERPLALSTEEAAALAERFGEAALWAREARFDGVQLHAAHGYLIHQFLHPSIGVRDDIYGPDPSTGIGTRFLEHCIEAVRRRAGADFPIWVKVSSGDDLLSPMTPQHFDALIRCLDRSRVDCIEVSYGTMDYPMSIFRGAVPYKTVLAHNAMFATGNPLGRAWFHTAVRPYMQWRHKAFAPGYNLPAATRAAQLTQIPVLAVGGLRSGVQMNEALCSSKLAGVSLCRPLLCDPNFIRKLESDLQTTSACSNCNRCAVMCDSDQPTRCYQR